MTKTIQTIKSELRRHVEPGRAENSLRFFQCGPGQYGEGDQFLGIRVPFIRGVVKDFCGLSIADTTALLKSPWHEERLFALLMLVDTFKRADDAARREIFDLYMTHTAWINNWDLVDLSAPHIPGSWLFSRNRNPLFAFAVSESLWERRIAILAAFYFIRNKDFEDVLKIAEILLHDEHDLIHKAVGWMLRETGKRDPATEERFLRAHYRAMPRTMLRYAIEKFPENRRQQYLQGLVD
ncbi:MAG: DNA alkylation repair protein [Thermodesulfobacteriota bacterium]|nr:DNA alkylation repair protein [Thermodesulfobacteriota bacterium]